MEEKSVEDKSSVLWQCLLAEVFGTFALTFADATAGIIGFAGGQVSKEAQAVVPGLLVMAMIFSVGKVSGAHINPAVTLSFAVRGVFPWRRVPAYWGAQVFGAILAAGLLRLLFGSLVYFGTTEPHVGVAQAFAVEVMLSLFLIFVILATATQAKMIGPNAAIPVAATIALCGLFGKPISGPSMNPARSLGPAIVSGSLDHVWIYVLAPALGGLLAVLFVWLLHGPPKSDEAEAAQGRGEKE